MRVPKYVGSVLLLAFTIFAFRLRQRDLSFLLDPDFNWQLIEAWRKFLATLAWSNLPAPWTSVYLDGQFIIYAVADASLRCLADNIAPLRPYFPSDLSFAFGGALLTNIIAYAGACTIFFATVYRLTGYLLISALAAIGVFLAPQMIAINIGRVDFLISLPLMAIFYCSCLLAIGAERHIHAILLGVAMAAVATFKINGLFFGIIPMLAAVAALRFDTIRRLVAFSAISVVIFLFVYAALMVRYFHYLSAAGVINYYRDAIAEVMRWSPILVGSPWYYHIDLMLGHGLPFIFLYLACALAVMVVAVRQRSAGAIFITLFVVFSLFGILGQKHSRAGYHLLPVYFAIIGLAAAAILNSSVHRSIKAAVLASGAILFLIGLLNSVERYAAVVAQRKAELFGIHALKVAPLKWLTAHVARGTTVCVQTNSEWTLPPLDDFKTINGPLALPYLDSVALAASGPPSLENLKKQCGLVVTSDWHRRLYNLYIAKASAATGEKWGTFFRSLDQRYPPTVFLSVVGVPANEIKINDLRGAGGDGACQRWKSSAIALEPPFVHDTGHAYTVSRPDLKEMADSIETPDKSPFILCENGIDMGTPHTVHEVIRRLGRRNFSHPSGDLTFSSSTLHPIQMGTVPVVREQRFCVESTLQTYDGTPTVRYVYAPRAVQRATVSPWNNRFDDLRHEGERGDSSAKSSEFMWQPICSEIAVKSFNACSPCSQQFTSPACL